MFYFDAQGHLPFEPLISAWILQISQPKLQTPRCYFMLLTGVPIKKNTLLKYLNSQFPISKILNPFAPAHTEEWRMFFWLLPPSSTPSSFSWCFVVTSFYVPSAPYLKESLTFLPIRVTTDRPHITDYPVSQQNNYMPEPESRYKICRASFHESRKFLLDSALSCPYYNLTLCNSNFPERSYFFCCSEHNTNLIMYLSCHS